jgi:hypothetical protein
MAPLLVRYACFITLSALQRGDNPFRGKLELLLLGATAHLRSLTPGPSALKCRRLPNVRRGRQPTTETSTRSPVSELRQTPSEKRPRN